jgi:hypothetical protein
MPTSGVNLNTSTSQNPQVSFSNPGTYTISLSTSNPVGAGNTYTQSITISDCTGLQQLSHDEPLKVYPNPSNGQITVETGSRSSSDLIVVDALGETLLRKTSRAAAEDLDLSNLPKGIYFLRIENEEGSRTVKIVRY